MAFTMTDQEYLEGKQHILRDYQKQARRYNKLSIAYLEKYKQMSDRCNRMMAEIENLKNKISQQTLNA